MTVATARQPPTTKTIEAVNTAEAILVAALAGPVTVTRAPVDIEALVDAQDGRSHPGARDSSLR